MVISKPSSFFLELSSLLTPFTLLRLSCLESQLVFLRHPLQTIEKWPWQYLSQLSSLIPSLQLMMLPFLLVAFFLVPSLTKLDLPRQSLNLLGFISLFIFLMILLRHQQSFERLNPLHFRQLELLQRLQLEPLQLPKQFPLLCLIFEPCSSLGPKSLLWRSNKLLGLFLLIAKVIILELIEQIKQHSCVLKPSSLKFLRTVINSWHLPPE